MAISYIKRARNSLREGKGAFNCEDYPEAMKLSQDCVQLSLKAALATVAVDVPFKHDFSDAFSMVKEKFPDWFSCKVPEFTDIAGNLKKRKIANNGVLFNKKEAEDVIKETEDIFKNCKNLINEIFEDT